MEDNVSTMIEQFGLYLNNNCYLIYKNALNIEYIKNNIDSNTSIIYFDNKFSLGDSLLNELDNNVFDKLIIIKNFKNRVRKKRLFHRKYFFKGALEHVKKRIFIIISLPDKYNEYKKLIKNLIKLRKICLKLNIEWENLMDDHNIVGYIVGQDSKYIQDIVNVFRVLLLNDQKQQYEFIYDITCQYLDSQFKNKNLCDFRNDQCIANRNKTTSHCDMGCCYSFEYAHFWEPTFIKNVKLCKHFQNKSCSTTCISCKMFTCKDLRKNNIYFKINNLLLLDCFFDKKQHLVLKYNFFKTREQIIDKLLETNTSPYLIYYLNNNYRIKDFFLSKQISV